MPKPRVRSFFFISDLQKGDHLKIATANGKIEEIEILDPEIGDIYIKREGHHKRRGTLLGSMLGDNPKKIFTGVIVIGFRIVYLDLIEQNRGSAFTATQKVWLNGEEILSAV